MTSDFQQSSHELAQAVIGLGKTYLRRNQDTGAGPECMPEERVREIARHRSGVDDRIISHTAACPHCYGVYWRKRQRDVWLRRVQVAAVALGLGAVAIAGVLQLIRLRPHQGTGAVAVTKGARPDASPASADAIVTIDLAAFARTRGDVEPQPRAIELPAKRVHVRFLLPLGVEGGPIEASLTSEDGTRVFHRSVEATIRDGVTSFESELDLAQLRHSRLLLDVSMPSFSRRTYQVVVGEP